MHDEAGFLAAIRHTPADDVARLVFADWLDEQDEPICRTKSQFIRLELRVIDQPERSLNRVLWAAKLQQLATRLDPVWLATVGHPKLEACRVAFQFECPKRWDKLTPTDDPWVRRCEGCARAVHYCNTLGEAQLRSSYGDCVALSPALVRQPNDIPSRLALGVLVTHRLPEPADEPVALPTFDLPPSPPVPQWVPTPPPISASRPRPKRKKARRQGHRNIQRDDWEDQ